MTALKGFKFFNAFSHCYSSAIIDTSGSFLYVGCYGGFLYKINSKTGTIVNSVQINGFIKCSPLLDKINNLICVMKIAIHMC